MNDIELIQRAKAGEVVDDGKCQIELLVERLNRHEQELQDARIECYDEGYKDGVEGNEPPFRM